MTKAADTHTQAPEKPSLEDLNDIQGLVARDYDRMAEVCHFVLKVDSPAAAKAFIGSCHDKIATARDNGAKVCLNLGFTFAGLTALGLEEECKKLRTKPELEAFVQGAAERADSIGDVGESAPRRWKDGLGKPDNVHALLSLYAEAGYLSNARKELEAAVKGAFNIVSTNPGARLPDGRIHFGYKDGISQPRVEGLPLRNAPDGSSKDPSRAGAFVLGYPSQFGRLKPGKEGPPEFEGHTYDFAFPADLGRNGTFAVFRIMEQDVHRFEELLTQQAELLAENAGPLTPEEKRALVEKNRELVAARICGRWRDGTPLVNSPNTADKDPDPDPDNTFSYKEKDPFGKACPFSAHIRRTNPRDDTVAGNSGQKHRIIRSAMPYGKPYGGEKDKVERGLLGLFFCANIADQFEFIMKNWVNRGGFQGNLPATNTDPLIGINSFIRTRGAAYCFFPSIKGLQYIAGNRTGTLTSG
jgi:Dyp-type peroxidase family